MRFDAGKINNAPLLEAFLYVPTRKEISWKLKVKLQNFQLKRLGFLLVKSHSNN